MFIKKGAMFGLESRALKKQFGKLFLARMQSVTPKEAHGASIQTKRGAMFGLDARIALVIFGSLSIISGAGLYSAIENSQNEAINQNLLAVEKAIAAYSFDVGNMSEYYPTYDIIQLNCLAQNIGLCYAPDALWKGPYIGEPSQPYWLLNVKVTGDKDFDAKLQGNRYTATDWTGTVNDPPNACNGTDCVIYIGYSTEFKDDAPAVANISTLIDDLFNRMDDYLDNGDGPRKGRVRKANPANPAVDNAVLFKTSISDIQY
jgi:hypothetical protein